VFDPDCLYADLALPEELRLRDEQARTRFGINPAVLMENAARAALEEIRKRVRISPRSRILIYMGKGNNGGDGAALARILHDEGAKTAVISTSDLSGLPSPADEHMNSARILGVNFIWSNGDGVPEPPEDMSHPDVVVDALCGTGFRGDLRPRELAYVRAVNAFRDRSFIVALDGPSGLCAYTGRARPEAVRADLSIAFQAGTPGLYLGNARAYTGELAVRGVGIPRAARGDSPACRLLSPRRGLHFLPPAQMHKGDAGKVLIVGGSGCLAGAPLLAGLGALRAGAGLVHLAVPEDVKKHIYPACPELMIHTAGKGADLKEEDVPALLDLLRSVQADALVLGPGAGRNPGTRAMLQSMAEESARPPTIFDADVLFFLRPFASALSARDVLTPHPGEAVMLLPDDFFGGGEALGKAEKIRTLQEDRPAALRALSSLYAATVVLKGAGTLIRRGSEPFTIAPFAVPTLAVGGAGDVLTGAVAALAASGMASPDAAALGVYLHGRAGELAARRAPRGHTASDIAGAIPEAWKELCEEQP
jgi:NAD(P)H-hydrate epimerase